MKVLLINGSSHDEGCTYTALSEVAGVLNKNGIKTEIINLGRDSLIDCTACGACNKLKKCVHEDKVNEVAQKAKVADGFIFGSPVYYAHPSGRILSFMDRLFYSDKDKVFNHKPAASIASCRRSGITASLDVINKYFTFAQMPIVSSSYWNGVHGNTPEETKQDLEGLETMRNIGENMTWLLKCIQLGKENNVLPIGNRTIKTSFIR